MGTERSEGSIANDPFTADRPSITTRDPIQSIDQGFLAG
jgi:hypothetical protein